MRSVQYTDEFRRVQGIPRRPLGADPAFTLALSERLRRIGSTATLLPIQAEALYEAHATRGLFGAIGVGGGKTLISLLAPTVLGARRPLLLVPAKLREKTLREQRALSRDWSISKHLRIESYERLSRETAAQEILRYRPDLIVLDEAHKAKSTRAAVTRRLSRYLSGAGAECMVVALSGTITKRSLRDYAHVLGWTHRFFGAPITRHFPELVDWCDALDERSSSWFGARCDPGALMDLATREDIIESKGDRLTIARLGYSRRLTETQGVIATHQIDTDASLCVETLDVPGRNNAALADAWTRLRRDWTLPNGQECIDGIEVWRHARELAMGFYYIWDPPPPDLWRMPRKAWARTVRQILGSNRADLDTEAQIVTAIKAGYGGPEAASAMAAWHNVKDLYEIRNRPVWLDDRVIRFAAEWLAEHQGIVWVEHLAVGHRLAEVTGLPFYGGGGLSTDGRNIESENGPCIASILANAEGRNLQRYHRSLVLSPPKSGLTWEQLLGRMHRRGQASDEVLYQVPITCIEHIGALDQAKADARYIQHSTRTIQKLTYCDWADHPVSHWAQKEGDEWDDS